MLLVGTFVGKSPGKGLGLFAAEFIPKGTRYWERNEEFDKIIPIEALHHFPLLTQDFVTIHGFQEITGDWYLCGDNARFTNHSEDPNTQNSRNEKGLTECHYTARDIQKGEEIFCDYKETCYTCRDGVTFNPDL